MTTNFKPGDRVKRMAESNILSIGGVYTVQAVNDIGLGSQASVELAGFPEIQFVASGFMPVAEKVYPKFRRVTQVHTDGVWHIVPGTEEAV